MSWLSKAFNSSIKGTVRNIDKVFDNVGDGLEDFYDSTKERWDGLGPVGQMAVLAAAGAGAYYWYASQAGAAAAITSAEASQGAMLGAQTAEFGAAGAEMTAESLLYAGSSEEALVASSNVLSDYAFATAETAPLASQEAYSQATSFENASIDSFDWKTIASAGAKTLPYLLGYDSGVGGYSSGIGGAQPTDAASISAAGTGAGLGFSQYTEQYAGQLTAGAREQEKRYQSLLSGGY